ncbi:hypothetical protein [Kitasatospora sp. NPDC096204]|uniref:hypothetical protein n=1 Tax=Kitasatospora sp. NPDC096204 TaxID=3364094 RepID=UPI0037FC355F
MASSSPLVRVLREAGDRPVLVADGHPVSGAELLAGDVPPGGLPEAMAARLATQLAFPAWEKDPYDQQLQYWAGILGPPPIRHTVLYPACGLTVDLALATLLTGGTVHCGEREQRADELLADLARSRTTHLRPAATSAPPSARRCGGSPPPTPAPAPCACWRSAPQPA